MKFRVSYKWILAVWVISMASCLDQIELEVPAGISTSIALQGQLIKGNPSVVTLSSSQIFDFTAESLQPITVKDPKIIDEEGNEVILEALGLGNYQAIITDRDDFKVEIGKSYKMRAQTFDGRTYESTFDPLIAVPTPEKLTSQFIEVDILNNQQDFERERQLQFSISTPLNSSAESTGILWELSRTFRITDLPEDFNDVPTVCYVTEPVSLNAISLVDPDDVTGTRIDDLALYAQPVDFKFSEGFYFTAVQHSLSQQAFDYWTNVNEIITREGNMFESPAGKIQSNFANIDDPEDEVFGFFFVSDTAAIHLSIDSTVVGSMGRFCPPNVPPPPGGGCPVLICCDCLTSDGASTVRPSFWK